MERRNTHGPFSRVKSLHILKSYSVRWLISVLNNLPAKRSQCFSIVLGRSRNTRSLRSSSWSHTVHVHRMWPLRLRSSGGFVHVESHIECTSVGIVILISLSGYQSISSSFNIENPFWMQLTCMINDLIYEILLDCCKANSIGPQ